MGIAEGELPFVSVIVVTLNRRKQLKNCLNSIFKLDYPPDRFEVIVVDGNSQDCTKEMIIREFPKVRFFVQKRKGLPSARNTGWEHAEGPFVAYTDDDCVVNRSWLKDLINGFTSHGIGAVGGPVLYLHPEQITNRFYQTPIGAFQLGKIERLLKRHENLITANMAIRFEAFKKVRFLESLVYADSEDYEFCWSLMEAGYQIKYVPNAVVLHDIDPNRASIARLLRRAFYSGISHYIAERRRNSRFTLTSKFLRAFLGGVVDFFRGERYESRLANFFWLDLCFVSFLSSIFLFYEDF